MRQPAYRNITPRELKERLEAGDELELLDVREPWEFDTARVEGSRLIPMNALPERISDLDPASETVVICHHGARSAHVTQVLERSGFSNVWNLEGGLDAYSQVDGSVPRY